MSPIFKKTRLELTEEEAFALLELAMTSATNLDATSEKAIHKLADFCREQVSCSSNHIRPVASKLQEAG